MAETLLRAFNFEIELLSSADGPSGAFGTQAAAEAAAAAAAAAAASEAGPRRPEILGNGGFQECSGLEVELDIQELLEGGRNDGVIRRVGRAKYVNIVLKRGMFFAGETVSTELWSWLQDVASGVVPVRRYDGLVRVMEGDAIVATWSFVRGLPAKISGPQLNALTGDIALEELHIAHEGLRLEAI